MEAVDLKQLLKDLDDHARDELASKPEVVDAPNDLDVSTLPITARRWTRIDELVAVVADLKNSTRLGTGSQHAASTASIYEAAVRPVVDILDSFDADDITIQGDGAFGVFWGDDRFERAMCAGITVKTFSEETLQPRLEKKWPELPPTGFKVGIASSRILVKRIGIPRTDHQEEVWAGKAVNYATKAAQVADRSELIVTGSVWDAIEGNDYLTISCGCGGGPSDRIWSDIIIDRLPDKDDERYGRKLTSHWCKNCGPEFCAAILSGKTTRSDARGLIDTVIKQIMSDSLRKKARQNRERTRGLRHVGAAR